MGSEDIINASWFVFAENPCAPGLVTATAGKDLEAPTPSMTLSKVRRAARADGTICIISQSGVRATRGATCASPESGSGFRRGRTPAWKDVHSGRRASAARANPTGGGGVL